MSSPATSETSPRFASQFGGLWTDRDNVHEVIAERLKSGQITSDEAELLRFWVTNGYVIIPNAAPIKDIDAALEDIDQMYTRPYGLIETFETGQLGIVPVEPRHRTAPHKLLDAYALSPKIRKAVLPTRSCVF